MHWIYMSIGFKSWVKRLLVLPLVVLSDLSGPVFNGRAVTSRRNKN